MLPQLPSSNFPRQPYNSSAAATSTTISAAAPKRIRRDQGNCGSCAQFDYDGGGSQPDLTQAAAISALTADFSLKSVKDRD